MKLTSSQRKYLRAQAHHLKPSVYVGKNDIVEGTFISIDNSFNARELIKVKFHDTSITDVIKETIQEKNKCDIAGSIGKTLILYKEHSDLEKRKIKLPK